MKQKYINAGLNEKYVIEIFNNKGGSCGYVCDHENYRPTRCYPKTSYALRFDKEVAEKMVQEHLSQYKTKILSETNLYFNSEVN